MEWQLSKYPSKLEEDERLLKDAKDARMKIALELRIRMKGILKHQIFLLKLANEINGRIELLYKETKGEMKDEDILRLITKKSPLECCDEFNVLINRRMMSAYYKSRGINIMKD